MREGLRHGSGVATVVIVTAFGAAGAAPAQAPPAGEPFAIEATVLVPLDNESALSIVGIHGQIVIDRPAFGAAVCRELRAALGPREVARTPVHHCRQRHLLDPIG